MRLGSVLSFGLSRDAALMLWAMFFTMAAWGFSDTLRPIYVESLGASPALVGVVLGFGQGLRIIFLFVGGMPTDRVSTRLLIAGSRSLVVVYPIIFVLATDWWHLLPAFFFGAASNMAWPAVSKVIADSSDDASRTRAFLLIYSIAPSVALLLTPAAGGWLAEEFGLRTIFIATAIGLAIAVLFFGLARPVTAPKPADGSGGYRDVLKERPVVLLCVVKFLLVFVLMLGTTLVPNYLEDIHAVPIGTIGQFGSLFAVGAVGIGLLATRLRWFRRPTVGMLAAAGFGPLMFGLLIGGDTAWLFGLAYVIFGGYYIASDLVNPAVGEVAPEHLRTSSFGLLEVFAALGMTAAPFAAGFLYGVDPRLPLWVSLGGSLIMLGVVYWCHRYVENVSQQLPLPEAGAATSGYPAQDSSSG
jgi:MFS family permease